MAFDIGLEGQQSFENKINKTVNGILESQEIWLGDRVGLVPRKKPAEMKTENQRLQGGT